jgi:hypothetical protein
VYFSIGAQTPQVDSESALVDVAGSDAQMQAHHDLE